MSLFIALSLVGQTACICTSMRILIAKSQQ